MQEEYKDIRCKGTYKDRPCNHLFFKAKHAELEVKCEKCGTVNTIKF